MKFFGLSGGIASGKSTVSGFFEELGATILDADAIYHRLIQPVAQSDGTLQASPLATAIDREFPGVLTQDGGVDRAELGKRVFGDAGALERLGRITHPEVAAAVVKRVQELQAQGLGLVLYDVPLLYERGLEAGMAGVAVVWVPEAIQIQRLMDRDGINEETARKKIASQMPLDEKRERATWTVDNSGDLESTRQQVTAIWEAMCD